MRFDDAWRELGIAPTHDPDTVRRAYLRGLKLRRPERDPEGFRRLREAYEHLASRLSAGWRPRPQVVPTLPIVPTALAAAVPPADAAVVAAGVEEPDGPPDSFDGFVHEDVDDEDLTAVELEARLRRWIAACPGAAEPYWRLIDLLREDEREREVALVLRAGDAAGLPGFFDTLIREAPSALTGGRLERLSATTDPDLRVALAAELALRGEAWPAASRLREALDLADSMQRSGLPLPGGLLSALLRLHAAGVVAPAQELTERVARRWRAAGIEQRILGDELAGRWIFLRELARLPATTPLDVRAALARSLLMDDPVEAASFLERRARDPAWARYLVAILKPLPAFGRLYLEPLEALAAAVPSVAVRAGPPASRSPTFGSRMVKALLLCWLVMAVLGWIVMLVEAVWPAKMVPPTPGVNFARSPALLELCMQNDELCLRGQILEAALAGKSCERMHDWLSRFTELPVEPERAGAVDRFLTNARDGYASRCPSESPDPP